MDRGSKKKAIHKMLESLITDDNATAEENLHEYLQAKMRGIILGEAEECDDDDKDDDKDSDDKDDDKDDKKSDKKEKKDDDDDDDDDDDEKVEEMDRSAQFARSGSVMSDAIAGKIKFKNGGKKTLKKHGNAPKELDDDKVGKTEFKKGGKQPAKVLEPTPKPDHFDDGREMDLGTTDK
jgi:hypothetical protein